MNRKAVEFRIILACASIVYAAVVMGVWLLYREVQFPLTQGLIILSLAAGLFIVASLLVLGRSAAAYRFNFSDSAHTDAALESALGAIGGVPLKTLIGFLLFSRRRDSPACGDFFGAVKDHTDGTGPGGKGHRRRCRVFDGVGIVVRQGV